MEWTAKWEVIKGCYKPLNEGKLASTFGGKSNFGSLKLLIKEIVHVIRAS